MTDTEINERLAKGIGWDKEWHFFSWGWYEYSGGSWLHTGEWKLAMSVKDWHPCSSLDQMHIVEERIIELGLMWKYTETVSSLCDHIQAHMVHATARQKAEAAVKVFEEVGK